MCYQSLVVLPSKCNYIAEGGKILKLKIISIVIVLTISISSFSITFAKEPIPKNKNKELKNGVKSEHSHIYIPAIPILNSYGYEVLSQSDEGYITIIKNNYNKESNRQDEMIKLNIDIKYISNRLYVLKDTVDELLKIKSSYYAKEIPVFMYHHLLKDNENVFINNNSILSVEKFQKQMEILNNEKFYTITLEELENFLQGKIALPRNSVLITFDDGYKSNYIYAYPILRKNNFNASVFMITDFINYEPTRFNPKGLQYFSWLEMADSKEVFEFAAHTHNLHRLDTYMKSYVVIKDRTEILKDLKINKELLDTSFFAYPYGQYKQETLDILKKLDFRLAFTTEVGYANETSNPLEVSRFGITPETSLEEFCEILNLSKHQISNELKW